MRSKIFGMRLANQPTHINITPDLIQVITVIHKPFVDGSNPTLAPGIIVPHKVLAVFVDGIVGQMHVDIILKHGIQSPKQA